MKRIPGLLTTLLAASAFAHAAQTQTWPAKPVRIVVPSPPSGAIDVAARLVAGKLPDYWGQAVIIANRADTEKWTRLARERNIKLSE